MSGIEINYVSPELRRIATALHGKTRVRIIELLARGPCNVSKIAQDLQIPVSTASVNVKILHKAGLVMSEGGTAQKKFNKVCRLAAHEIRITLPQVAPSTDHLQRRVVHIPIGQYTDCHVVPPCGIASSQRIIGSADVPASFWEPDRVQAGLLWFANGYVEYRVPNRLHAKSAIMSIEFSMEISSEHPFFDNNWPSDITLWLNRKETGTWTVPGDFGDRRGRLNPPWWSDSDSQYGLLKRWVVSTEGTFVDGGRLSHVTIGDLHLKPGITIPLRIGIKADARHKGGLNLYGRSFGNYPQDIVVEYRYRES